MILRQDNHDKLRVDIASESLESELKRFFGWRKDVTLGRLCKQGSHKYDAFIKFLSDNGY